MSMITSTTPALSAPLDDALDDLAWAIARDGIERHELALARTLESAAAGGADPTLIAIVGDRNQPAVARERAFGHLSQPTRTAAPAADPRRLAA